MNVARISPDGRYVAGACSDNPYLKLCALEPDTLQISDLATGNFHIHPINDIAWSPCSQYIATGGEDCVVVIWRIRRNEKYTVLEPRRVLRGHVAAVTSLAYNNKGTMLASGSVDEKAIVWNVKGGTLFKLLNAHSKPIVSVDLSYDNKLLLTASYDGFVRIWSLIDGMALRIISGAEQLMPICSARFSPNSAYALITHTDGITRMVDLVSKQVVKMYGCESKVKTEPSGVANGIANGAANGVANGTANGNVTNGNVTNGNVANDGVANDGVANDHVAPKEEEIYPRELAFCHPNYILVGKSHGIVVYDIKSQEQVHSLTNVPVLCIDTNEKVKVGLCAGSLGLELFKLNFT